MFDFLHVASPTNALRGQLHTLFVLKVMSLESKWQARRSDKDSSKLSLFCPQIGTKPKGVSWICTKLGTGRSLMLVSVSLWLIFWWPSEWLPRSLQRAFTPVKSLAVGICSKNKINNYNNKNTNCWATTLLWRRSAHRKSVYKNIL